MSGCNLLNSLTIVARPSASWAVPRIATRSASSLRPGMSDAVRRGHAATVPRTPTPAAAKNPRRLMSAIATSPSLDEIAAALAVKDLDLRGVEHQFGLGAGLHQAGRAQPRDDLGARTRDFVDAGVLRELVQLGRVNLARGRVEVGV